MNEQALDLRGSVRRHKILIGILIAMGLLIGAGYSVLKPPMLTAAALVVLPEAIPSQSSSSTLPITPGTDAFMATQVVIATSDPVLSGALPQVSPTMLLQALRGEVQAKSLTDSVLSISATGRTAVQAEATANAVAYSYKAYVGSGHLPGQGVPAYVFQPATSATGMRPIEHLLIYVLIGAVAGILIGIIAALAISRADRRLRKCDEIAASVGIPVLASIPVFHPTDAMGWTKVLEDYEPGAVHALRLRQALRELGIAGISVNGGGGGARFSLAVLSLSSDPGAVALGPQLAAFAASLGIPTTLAVGPQQETTAAAALRIACSVPPPASSKLPRHLRLAVIDSGGADRRSDALLTISVMVVDGRNPRMTGAMHTTATVLGVSAGAATAEQLARAASSAAADGCEIVGILVADPDPTDYTSNHIMRAIRLGMVQAARTPQGYRNANQKVYDSHPSTEIRR